MDSSSCSAYATTDPENTDQKLSNQLLDTYLKINSFAYMLAITSGKMQQEADSTYSTP